MSLHYLLDGYNIIHQMPDPVPSKLENQRLMLVRFAERFLSTMSRNNKVIIVFDGQPAMGQPEDIHLIKVLFSCGQSADDKIKQIVHSAENPKVFVVVTDDRSIQKAVRLSGAKILAVKDFINKTQQLKSADSTSRVEKISYVDEVRINEELKQIWIKKKNKDKS